MLLCFLFSWLSATYAQEHSKPSVQDHSGEAILGGEPDSHLAPYRAKSPADVRQRPVEYALIGFRLGSMFGWFGQPAYEIQSTGQINPSQVTTQFNSGLGVEIGYAYREWGAALELEYAPLVNVGAPSAGMSLVSRTGTFWIAQLGLQRHFAIGAKTLRVKFGADLVSTAELGFTASGYGGFLGVHYDFFSWGARPLELYLRFHWDRVTSGEGTAVKDLLFPSELARRYFAFGIQICFL